jgi:pilus assembly protein CpaB
MLKNRTFLGTLAIILALVICFGISPLFTKAMEEKIDIVMVKSPVKKGEMLSANNISVIQMGAYNMPTTALNNPNDVIGKYAKSDLYMGSIVLADMLSDSADTSDTRLRNLKDNEMAMDVTIKSLAEGFSGKLLPGDIIRIVSVDEDKTATIYDELAFVEVLTTTTKDGNDTLTGESASELSEANSEEELPVTITVILQDNLQALRLAECEETNLHAIFINRDPGKTEQYISLQADILTDMLKDDENAENAVIFSLPDEEIFQTTQEEVGNE